MIFAVYVKSWTDLKKINPRKNTSVSEPKQKAFLRGLKIYRY